MTPDSTELIESFRAIAPSLASVIEPATVRQIGEGDFCTGYLVADEWVFRVARKPEGSRCLGVEIALEPAVADHVELPVPRVEHSGRCPRGGELIAAHRYLPGEPVSPQRYRRLPAEVQHRLAADLGHFLTQLHAYPAEAAERACVQRAAYHFCRTEHEVEQGTAAELYGRDLQKAQRLLEAKELVQDLERLLGQFLERGEPDRGSVLVHGDLSGDHVLLAEGGAATSAVIDFSDLLLCDPLLDLAYLFDAYGEDFLRRLLMHYPLAGDRERAAHDLHFLHIWHVLLRLLWAVGHDWKEGIDYWGDRLAALQRQRLDAL